MSIKLVALDMDGTLLNSSKELPPDFMGWVESHPDIKTVIASGRQYYTIIGDFAPIKDKLIYVAENGGLVFENGEVIYRHAMQKEDVHKCLEVITGVGDLIPVACGEKSAYTRVGADVRPEINMYYTRLQPAENLYSAALGDAIVKIAVFVEDKKAEESMKYFADMGNHMEAVLSGDSWIDISYRTACKGAGIAAVQNKYGISQDESMAFGDYLNDVSLFDVCGESYCMANGHPDLKKLAKYVTDSNDDNGVMNVLRLL